MDVKIIAAVRDVDGARVALETLEHGTDGIIFEANDFNNIKKIAQNVIEASQVKYELKFLTRELKEKIDKSLERIEKESVEKTELILKLIKITYIHFFLLLLFLL